MNGRECSRSDSASGSMKCFFIILAISILRFQTFQDEVKEKNLLNDGVSLKEAFYSSALINVIELFPCGIDGIKLENIIYKFVSNYLDIFYNETTKKYVAFHSNLSSLTD
jgi:hypothetical protein